MFANTTRTSFTPKIFEVLAKLESSHFEMFLTGSRFFGEFSDESDYDFFTEECGEVEAFLLDNGFVLDSLFEYFGDPTFSKVYTFEDETGKIQVQLIHPKEFSRKQLIQRLLTTSHPHGLPRDKNLKRELWLTTHHVLKELGIS